MIHANRFGRYISALLLFYAFGARAASDAAESIRKGGDFLWAEQAEDGGWHSRTYELLRSGQALTPFVLNSLLQSEEPLSAAHKAQAARAVAFIKARLTEGGALGMANPILHDYPNYATALAVEALSRDAAEKPAAAKMIGYLHSQQFAGAGWSKEHPAFGAWGMGGITRTPREPGHLDLSMTRNVLEALRNCEPKASAGAFDGALIFLSRCQNLNDGGDGGFFFSTVVLEANKAGSESARFRSYGTATADGILALLACGVKPDDTRVQSALQWLLAHHRTGAAPGFPDEITKHWDTGLQYYYYAALARVFKQLNIHADLDGRDLWSELRTFLIKSQHADGSWANDNFLVKEDDPLVATVFAISALSDLREK